MSEQAPEKKKKWFQGWFEPMHFESEAERNEYIRTGRYKGKGRYKPSGFEGLLERSFSSS